MQMLQKAYFSQESEFQKPLFSKVLLFSEGFLFSKEFSFS